MKADAQGDTLRVSQIGELGAAEATAFRAQVRAALTESQRNIDIDLSETPFIDSSGLGTLIALHKTARARKGAVRLLNPQPPVRQILELTQMGRIFEIINS
jgi:anti-sigma B factor antagonist